MDDIYECMIRESWEEFRERNLYWDIMFIFAYIHSTHFETQKNRISYVTGHINRLETIRKCSLTSLSLLVAVFLTDLNVYQKKYF